MAEVVRVAIRSDADIVMVRQQARVLAKELGFSASDLTLIATALSELARNIVDYAGQGEIILSLINQGGHRGLVIIARDNGPGITDIERAMQDGYSTGKGLGMGLPGTRRLMDEFEISSGMGQGTTVKVTKWAR
ncbi:MAG: anti-sigma regulatory factor [Methylococcales bacterium]|nr:anti-sigma regulatory factor [Methylococcales bacterium]